MSVSPRSVRVGFAVGASRSVYASAELGGECFLSLKFFIKNLGTINVPSVAFGFVFLPCFIDVFMPHVFGFACPKYEIFGFCRYVIIRTFLAGWCPPWGVAGATEVDTDAGSEKFVDYGYY